MNSYPSAQHWRHFATGAPRLLALAIALALSVAAPGSLVAEGLPDLGDSADSVVSPAKEREYGERFMQQVRADPSYVDDPEIEDYVRNLGRRLTNAARDHRERARDIDFFVIRDDTPNAFAMVGGFIGIHTGLIAITQNEAELAAVLAHEIGHVVQRHQARGLENQGKLNLASLAGLAAAILAARSSSSSSGNITQAAIAASQALPIQLYLNYTREFEREADRSGALIMEQAGFDATAGGRFFGRLLAQGRFNDPGESRVPGYLRTHPLTTERIADAQNREPQAAALASKGTVNSPEFERMRATIDAQTGEPADAVQRFRDRINQQGVKRSPALVFGYAHALARARRAPEALEQLKLIPGGLQQSGVVAARCQFQTIAGNPRQAVTDGQAALAEPGRGDWRALRRCVARAQLAANDPKGALQTALTPFVLEGADVGLLRTAIEAGGQSGRVCVVHAAQGELLAREGRVREALDNLERAAIKGRTDDQCQSQAVLRAGALRSQYRDALAKGRDFDER